MGHQDKRSNDEQTDQRPKRKGPGILKILQSVLAGAIGVQSSKRREEDFSSHSPWPFIVAGLLFTAGFVIVLALIVRWVLASQ